MDSVKLYYESIGEGKPVVMLHGAGVDRKLMIGCMEPIFKQLSGYRRIYIDLPGMGKSTNIDGIAGSDDVIIAVIDTINSILENIPFILVGESYGGYLARGIIEKMKSQILGVCFLCPMMIPDASLRVLPSDIIKQYDATFLDTLSLEEKDAFCQVAVVANADTYQRFKEEILPGIQCANQIFMEQLQKQYAFTFALETDVYNQPTLFIMGRQDQIVGYQDAITVSKYYTRATLMILDEAGHNLQIEQPGMFNVVVKEWLQRIHKDTSS